MGCGSSQVDAHDGPPPGVNLSNIGPPQEAVLHIPRRRMDQHGVELPHVTQDMNRATLLAALTHVSNYIGNQRRRITVIAVGGAVNTLLLRSRDATHDVDIFGSNLQNIDRTLLDRAMQDAQSHVRNLGTDWLNTETQLWIGPDIHRQLTQEAMQQNIPVFQGRGLVVLAAPWRYAFCAKADRLLKHTSRAYDLADAVTYIHEHIRSHGGRPLAFATVVQWYREFGIRIDTNALKKLLRERLNQEYRRRFNGQVALTF